MKKRILGLLRVIGDITLVVLIAAGLGTATIFVGLEATTAKPEDAIHSMYRPVTPCTTEQYRQAKAAIEATYQIHLEEHWWGITVTTIKHGKQTTAVAFFNKWVKLK